MQDGDDLAAEPDAVVLVACEVVGQPRDPGVHRRPAELLVVGLLAGGHLDQRRPAEEHLGRLVDHDGVVAHARDVGAACGGVPEDQGDGGDAHGRELRQVVEDLAGRDEQVGLGRQVGAARLDQVDHGQPVEPGDLECPEVLPQGVRVDCPTPDRRDQCAMRTHSTPDTTPIPVTMLAPT